MIVKATNVKDPEKRNDLINFSNSRKCKVFSDKNYGIVVECQTYEEAKIMQQKVKELSD